MLPAWATVLIAAISAAAGVVTGVILTWIRIRFDRDEAVLTREHEREQQTRQLQHSTAEEWRDRKIRAADDFSTGVEQAILGVRNLIETVARHANAANARREASQLTDEAVARLARIKLLFGEESPPVAVAKDLLGLLDLARQKASDPRGGGWEAMENVYELHALFNTTALKAINEPVES